ncbi:MAG TPA: DUF1543 domain-containing protein [Caulobacteraceae bacterium]|jgi:hypothetical protein|nr:DUF1543 domain-containing protein [Caulobacteraceae bacterium]
MGDQDKLFAVCLGGRAEGCNTELHDIVFVTGPSIEATYDQLLDRWFGLPRRLHLDAWAELDVIDGYEVSLAMTPDPGEQRLFFVNLGAYREGELSEVHANGFLVAATREDAKRRAKATLLQVAVTELHTDDLYEVDTCLELGAVNGLQVVLTPTTRPGKPKVMSTYRPLPEAVIEAWIARRGA